MKIKPYISGALFYASYMSSGMVDGVLNSTDEIEAGLENQAAEIVREHDNVLIDMNTGKLREGKDSTGSNITPQYYAEDYAMMKNRMNPRPGLGTPDLFLEGDFQEGFFVKSVESGWELDSKDEKRNKLASKYGDEIFGNTEADEEEFNKEYISPELSEWMLTILNERL